MTAETAPRRKTDRVQRAERPAPPRTELDRVLLTADEGERIGALTDYIARGDALLARARAERQALARELAAAGTRPADLARLARLDPRTVRGLLREKL